jgi:Tfp pilus assembly protein PilV
MKARAGTSIIDVILALVLLAIAGTALVTLLGQTAHSIESLRATEHQTQSAGLELGALAVLSKSDFSAHIGTTRRHGWVLSIGRLTPDLFDVSIAASDTGLTLLRTTLYRPDSTTNAIP